MRSIVIVTALAAIGCSQKPQFQGVDGLATQVPASSVAFAAVDAREKMPADFRKTVESKKDDPRLKPQLENYKRQTGHDAATAIQAFEPTAWGILVDTNGKKDYALVAGILLRDRKKAEECLAQSNPNEKPTKSGNIDTYKAGYSIAFAEPFMLISNKPAGITAALQKGPRLADDSNFKAAHSQMFQNQSLAFVYSPVPVEQKGIRYLAGGVGKESPYRPAAFLSLDPSAGTALVKSLLTKPAASIDYVPANWNFNLKLQLRYPLAALAQVHPKALTEASNNLKDLGTSSAQMDKAFEGDVALGLDLDQYFAKGMPQGPPNGLLAVGLRNPAEFEAFWKAYSRSNNLKTSPAKVGTYQVDRLTEVPYMLLARQGKQALLVLANHPDDVLKSLKPGKSDDSILSLRYDLDNTRTQLAKTGLLSMSPQLGPLQAQMQNSSAELWKGDLTAKVEKDGVKAEGNPVTMLIALIMQIALLSEVH